MPVLISTIKSSGLMLGSFGPANLDSENVKIQEEFGADATIKGRVFKYKMG
jgi:hypothetical protein